MYWYWKHHFYMQLCFHWLMFNWSKWHHMHSYSTAIWAYGYSYYSNSIYLMSREQTSLFYMKTVAMQFCHNWYSDPHFSCIPTFSCIDSQSFSSQWPDSSLFCLIDTSCLGIILRSLRERCFKSPNILKCVSYMHCCNLRVSWFFERSQKYFQLYFFLEQKIYIWIGQPQRVAQNFVCRSLVHFVSISLVVKETFN